MIVKVATKSVGEIYYLNMSCCVGIKVDGDQIGFSFISGDTTVIDLKEYDVMDFGDGEWRNIDIDDLAAHCTWS